MQKNKMLMIAGAIVLIILLAGGFFLFKNQSVSKTESTQNTTVDKGPQTVSPEEIGLELEASPDSKKVRFTIEKVEGIKSISYELTYEADPTSEEKSEGVEEKIPRGITGEDAIKSGTSEYTSPWLDLGSCSKNVCRYDTGVESVHIILKLTKTDGKVLSTEQDLKL